ncbi:hypothetical protein GOV10_03730 [Candidatus Woesearchaeota archaeon]|nr:hypothetical protein [Candidatus Woesearchaeota archaeon]
MKRRRLTDIVNRSSLCGLAAGALSLALVAPFGYAGEIQEREVPPPRRIENPRRVKPTAPIQLPKAFGAVVAFSDMTDGVSDNPHLQIEPNYVSAQRMTDLGYHGIKLWPRADVLSDDIRQVFDNPDLELIVMRPLHGAEREEIADCYFLPFAYHDYGEIAEKLYENYGDRDVTVVLSNWETDNQVFGGTCNLLVDCEQSGSKASRNKVDTYPFFEKEMSDPYSLKDLEVSEVCEDYVLNTRIPFIKNLLEERQRGINAARARHPDAKLRVYGAVEVTTRGLGTRIPDYDWYALRNLVPDLDPQPDVISLSYWSRHKVSIEEAIQEIKFHTGFPSNRIYIGEIGTEEKNPGDQYEVIYENFNRACSNEDVCAGFAWLWLQGWPGKDLGLWVKDENGRPTDVPKSGVQALTDLQNIYH